MNGFVRDALGNVAIFNPDGSTGTQPIAISAQGFVTGSYESAGRTLGFVRAPDGTITSFQAVQFFFFTTLPSDINASGAITGSVGGGNTIPAFLRLPDGTFTGFSVPFGKGTVPFAINEVGAITGVSFQFISDSPQGFVSSPDGTYIFLSVGFYETIPFGINTSGTIAGFYRNPPISDQGGFVRSPDGTVTKFALPGGGSVPPEVPGRLFYGKSTSGVSGGINAQGSVTGTYVDQNNISHGFLRSPNGTLATIDLGPGNTSAVSINDLGEVTGSYQQQGESVGYLRVQSPPSVTCAATPNTLWPPNGKPVVVTVSGTVTPGAQPIASGGAAYAVVDEYGQVQPSGRITLGVGGSYSFGVSLIAARNGDDHDGRTYTIVVGAKDAIGRLGSCSTVVTVPHDQGN